jgi:hypothetical protein
VTTSIFVPRPLVGYELCHPADPANFEMINVTINGVPRGASWQSPKMEIVREDEGIALLASDTPWLGAHALIFRPGPAARMRRSLELHGELLPLDCGDSYLSIYNPTQVIDALDEQASSLTRFRDGRIMMIKRHAFKADRVRDADIFKITSLRVSPTFVSRAFVDAWNSLGFVGLRFERVWSPN